MTATLLALLWLAPLAADDTDPPGPKLKAREIAFTGEHVRSERLLGDPVKVTAAAELSKYIPGKSDREAVLKNVDLKKEYLLVFRWSGSGGDKLDFSTAKDGEVVFTHTRGEQKDLRHHFKLYALPAKAKYKVSK